MAPKLETQTGGLTADDFLEKYREMRSLKRALETASSNYQNAVKKMKGAGADLFALGILEKLVKVEEEQATLHIRNIVTYAGWTGANVGLKQGDLFVGQDMPQPTAAATEAFVESVAEDQGYAAGRAREKADINPHAAGTAPHAAWARGWNRGQAEEVTNQFGKPAKAPKPAKVTTRRWRNPAAETRDGAATTLDATMAKLNDPAPADPAFEAAADAAAEDRVDIAEAAPPSNVVPIGRAKPAKPAAKAVTPKARAKASKAAIKAAEKLTGAAQVNGAVAGESVF